MYLQVHIYAFQKIIHVMSQDMFCLLGEKISTGPGKTGRLQRANLNVSLKRVRYVAQGLTVAAFSRTHMVAYNPNSGSRKPNPLLTSEGIRHAHGTPTYKQANTHIQKNKSFK